jgi:hypothetical protein
LLLGLTFEQERVEGGQLNDHVHDLDVPPAVLRLVLAVRVEATLV